MPIEKINELEIDLSKRNKKYGIYSICNRHNTNDTWCILCDLVSSSSKKTSGSKEIDDEILLSQLQSSSYDDNYLELIDEHDVGVPEFLCSGGNGLIYRGVWGLGRRYIKGNKKCREANTMVILKQISDDNYNNDEKEKMFIKEVSSRNLIRFMIFLETNCDN